MERSELKLLSEAYTEVKLKHTIEQLFAEGKTEEQIAEILSEAGLGSRIMSRIKAYNPFDKQTRSDISNVIRGSDTFKKANKFANDKLGINTGITEPDELDVNASLGNIRQNKLQALVDQHSDDIMNAVETFHEATISMKRLLTAIIHDLNKIGGVSAQKGAFQEKLIALEQDILDHVIAPYMHEGGTASPEAIKDQVITKIVGFINSQKTGRTQKDGPIDAGLASWNKVKPS